jgi:hypothetical protein
MSTSPCKKAEETEHKDSELVIEEVAKLKYWEQS